uniref:GM06790p n=1 Tax=Drosophila melanogaster TaxID=7227 RepID=Q95S74_DROME|nr:GM06790p [Drosophila melanogaster]
MCRVAEVPWHSEIYTYAGVFYTRPVFTVTIFCTHVRHLGIQVEI